MGFRVVIGTIKNNTNEEYVKHIEGIRVMCCEFPKGHWSVCGGADDENMEKYKRAAWEHMGKEDGYKTYEEFEKIYAESTDYGAGLAMENLIDIEEIADIDLDKTLVNCKMGLCTFNENHICLKKGVIEGGDYKGKEAEQCTCKEYREVCNWTECEHNRTLEGHNYCNADRNLIDETNCPSAKATIEDMIESGQMVLENGEYVYKG